MLLDSLIPKNFRGEPHPFVSDKSEALSYRGFCLEVERVRQILVTLGIEERERVGVVTNNSVASLVAIFAVNELGAVFVPINYRASKPSIAAIIEDCQITHLLSPQQDVAIENRQSSPYRVGREQSPPLYVHSLCLAHRDSECRIAPPDELVALFYTSGSTGRAKGVMIGESNLVLGAKSVANYLKLKPNDTSLCVLPISFDAGLNQVLSTMVAGGSVHLISYLLPNDVATAVLKYGVSSLIAVPPLYARILGANWSSKARSQISRFASTGGAMPVQLLKKMRALFPNAQPYVMYGLTEAFRATYLHPDAVDLKQGSIGKAIPHAEVWVVDAGGRRCKPNQIGEIVQCGPLVTLGYWRANESATPGYARFVDAPVYSKYDGLCVYSGDLGYTDVDEYLYFFGRQDGMLKVQGKRVSPVMLESSIVNTPFVDECVVIGDTWSQPGLTTLCVVAVARDGDIDLEPTLNQVLLDIGLSNSELPSRYFTRASLPRDLNGKIDRNACIRWLQSL